MRTTGSILFDVRIRLHAQPHQCHTSAQVLADTAAADALAAKGASDVDAKQMQAMLRSLMAEALQSSSDAAVSSPTGGTQQAMLRYALARHGMLNSLMIVMTGIDVLPELVAGLALDCAGNAQQVMRHHAVARRDVVTPSCRLIRLYQLNAHTQTSRVMIVAYHTCTVEGWSSQPCSHT